MNKSFIYATLAYVVPSFIIAYFWHLGIFAPNYVELDIYREEVLVPLGFASVVIQGVILALIFGKVYGENPNLSQGLRYGFTAGLFSWTYTTLAVAAKYPMTSIMDYVLLETGFTFVQYVVVGPLTALAWRWGGSS